MSDNDQNINVVVPGDKEELFGTVENVVEEKKDMIDFSLVEDEKAAHHIDHTLEEIIEDSVALESYITLLRSAGHDGVSKQTAKAIAIGVARIDRRFGIKSPLVCSLEDEASESKSIGHDQQKSGVNEEGLVGRAKELWAKFVEFLRKALANIKSRLTKIKEKFTGMGPKIEKFRAGFKDWSPNDAGGGKKISIPALEAQYLFKDGNDVNLAEVVALMDWCNAEIPTFVKKTMAKIKSLTGKEPAEQIRAIAHLEGMPAPRVIPVTLQMDIGADEITISPNGDEQDVTIPVRSKSQVSKALDGCGNINDAARRTTDEEVDIFSEALEAQFSVVGSGEASQAVKAAMSTLQGLLLSKSVIMSYCLHVGQCSLNRIGREQNA